MLTPEQGEGGLGELYLIILFFFLAMLLFLYKSDKSRTGKESD